MKWTFDNQIVLHNCLENYVPFVKAVNRHFKTTDKPVMCFHYCEQPRTDGTHIRVGIPWVWRQPNLRSYANRVLVLAALGVFVSREQE